MKRADLWRYWLPALAWAVLILALSGNGGSSEKTGEVLEVIIQATVGPVPEETFMNVHMFVRKAGHVIGYAILAALNFRAIRGRRPGWHLAWAVLAVLLASGIATLDELHQSHFESRSGRPADVALDAAAAMLTVIAWRGIERHC